MMALKCLGCAIGSGGTLQGSQYVTAEVLLESTELQARRHQHKLIDVDSQRPSYDPCPSETPRSL